MNFAKQDYQNYTDRIARIRFLATPSLDGISDGDGYSERLCAHFTEIGRLAAKNREFIETRLNPIIQSDDLLDDETSEEMSAFEDELVSAELAENLDLPVAYFLSKKLVRDAEARKSLPTLIHCMDARMTTLYELLIMTMRITPYPEISGLYRDAGMKVGAFFLNLLKKENFEAIEDETSREIVLTNARYSAVFYEGVYHDKEANKNRLALLLNMLEIAEDPFYKDLVPHFDWMYFRYRTLEYISMSTEFCNEAGFNGEQLKLICDYSEKLCELWDTNTDYFEKQFGNDETRIFLSFHHERNRYLAGLSSVDEYKKALLALYEDRKADGYNQQELFINLSIPVEYMCLLDPEYVSLEDYRQLDIFYRNVLSYAFHMPNSGSLFGLLEYYMGIIDRFIEIPGRISFEDMMLQGLAAFHPPTYIHSAMVAQLTRCLTEHLILQYPDVLIGVLGCSSVDDVLTHRTEIIDFAYHAALCHDFGKLTIIDTIFVYGRKLYDIEFDLIKTHPRSGYEMLMRYESTRPYAPIALGHHKWYDNSRGYPHELNPETTPLKPLIDLIQCVDCMDAATDSIGRSYKGSLSLDSFLEEVKAGAGTRYAPWLTELLSREDVYKDVRRLLKKERPQVYRNTYYLLRGMQNN